MEVEQRYIIKFFVEEGMNGTEIINTLKNHYGPDALKQNQVYYWINEVNSRRKDLSNIPSPGRASDEGLDDCIAKALAEDPHLSARKIAKALHISTFTVRHHLTNSLGMKCYHMR
jgi:transposase